ncbi:polysaccharide deacetylase family protein [Oxalobacter sp. OttesenSCG-928-P03]|nr:polysaccharide deacetylase family protein [Oxalobacter sp. OttesenSCG-928-P03]
MRHRLKLLLKPIARQLPIYRDLHREAYRLLGLYNSLSSRWNKQLRATAPILLYHRVDMVNLDPQHLCVPPKIFAEHLAFLKQNYEVISLPRLVERVKHRALTGREAVITFDDGYRDNFINALPILERYELPATIYVTTGQLGQRASFAWDMEYDEKDRAYFLSKTEINVLGKHPLIEIGAHTHNHSRLSDLSPQQQFEEMVKSKTILEELIGRPVTSFAYPFGRVFDYNSISTKQVKQIGFTHAVANTPQLVTNASCLEALPRFNIRACSVEILGQILLTKAISLQK